MSQTKDKPNSSGEMLYPVLAKPPLGIYLYRIWQARYFVKSQAAAKATTQHADKLLGNLWMILGPILDASFYFVVFGLVLKVDRGINNFPAYLIIGVYLFEFTSKSLNGAAGLMTSSRSLIQSFSFPRMSIVVANVLRDTLTLIPTLIVMFVLVILIPPHAYPTRTWLLLPLLLILQIIFNLGIALVSARLTHWIPDLGKLIGVFSRFWMYGSGVMFAIERYLTHPFAAIMIEWNPAYQILSIARNLLLNNTIPPFNSWAILTISAFGFLTIGVIYFWQGETKYGQQRN